MTITILVSVVAFGVGYLLGAVFGAPAWMTGAEDGTSTDEGDPQVPPDLPLITKRPRIRGKVK